VISRGMVSNLDGSAGEKVGKRGLRKRRGQGRRKEEAYNEFAAIVVFHLIGKMRRKSSQLGRR
jgi:hypothetical protein